ncbi:hypothetical protein ECHHL_0319 [Ehrlichia chaffeensis str. Heartland]|nr:hypothetical protein ECHHL_0319 [Ehrlichia chaffeensis str. Heartland]AHX05796.1 hypothetical protein ECHJAX_0739 [Ehrlichia chaffeensis str. Jax]AHX06788.1 hypothetical protein ECHLIB_0743 [Ehrlichia chaffeensis str. Liberty]AHX08900.1 hypothetical protein ECHSTV_0727 [Ehrlichia chaffeensis str. Saint Vincent]AHX10145.1 hypothetical protein ECHWP_0315 [Ehrlichia chaffeensis str. West Paces]
MNIPVHNNYTTATAIPYSSRINCTIRLFVTVNLVNMHT